jgi:hypothetical protein
MPGQLPKAVEQTRAKDYKSIKRVLKEKVAALLGLEVTMTTKYNGNMKWTVNKTSKPLQKNAIVCTASALWYERLFDF